MAEEKQDKKELEEKKKKFLEASPKKTNKKHGFPVYLVGMLLVAGLLAGIAVMLLFFPPQTPGNINVDENTSNDVTYRTVPVTIIYTDECKSCRQTNMVEPLFLVRQIPYTMKKVEASSPEGVQLLKRFEIDTFPTAIVDADKIDKFYPSTKKSFEGTTAITKQKNAYIVPELNLDPNFYFPVYFKEPVTSSCTGDKPTALVFDDFYAPQNSETRKYLYDFIADYNKAADIKFSFAQSVSADANSALGNIFLTCASDQGKFAQMEYYMAGIYCNNAPGKGDSTIMTQVEIKGCSNFSEHYGTPLTNSELDRAANRAILDQNMLVSCVANKEIVYDNARKMAQEAGITRTGTVLLDCHETTSLITLKESFCAMHPDLCKEETPDA